MFNRVLNTPLMMFVAGYGDNLFNLFLFSILAKRHNQYYFVTVMAVTTIGMMA